MAEQEAGGPAVSPSSSLPMSVCSTPAGEVTVCLLADRPDFVPILAGWFWSEWAPTYRDFNIMSEEEVARDMVERTLNRDRRPLTLVAFIKNPTGDGSADVPIATVTLDTEDLPTHRHIDSWLVCVYTAEPYRGKGLMRILLPMILDKATELGLPEVWLWTLDGTAPFYEKYGWVRQESTIYQDEPIAIMRALLPRASSTA